MAEDLTDRQAAEAVRTRIDWKYALGLDLADLGFDHSVLSEFRGKVAAGGLEQGGLDALLTELAAPGPVRGGGDRAPQLPPWVRPAGGGGGGGGGGGRGEGAGEGVGAGREALTAAPRAGLEQGICGGDFARRHGTPMTSWRPPASAARRDELAVAYARDGFALLG